MADPNPPAAAAGAADPLAPRADFAPIFPIEAWEGQVEAQAREATTDYAIAAQMYGVISDQVERAIRGSGVRRLPGSLHSCLVGIITVRIGGECAENTWRDIRMLTLANTFTRDVMLFLVARLTDDEIIHLREFCQMRLAEQRVDDWRRVEVNRALAALQIEETRRANRARYLEAGRVRGVMRQADLGVFADRLPGGRDVFNHIIAPMASGLVTSQRNPLRPDVTGPLPTNRDRLAQLVANAQVAAHAAAANPAQARDLLIGVARSISELNDSVVEESNKRHKH